MTFPRAYIIAFMATIMLLSDDGWIMILAAVVGGALWFLTVDPLPSAVRKGLDAYAQDYRR